MHLENRRFLLASRPVGAPTPANFRLDTTTITDDLAPGEVLVRNRFLSLDPYMRGRMSDAKSYAEPQPLDQVMVGGTVGEVVASAHPGFTVGDSVAGMGGWQEYHRVDANARGVLRKVDTRRIPLSAYLGPVGMPGVTAWYGLTAIVKPEAGRTIVVSSASGAVGSLVGQLAKARGCRVVGIAGGPAKCEYVVRELGFDACLDYKALADDAGLRDALVAACPDGIDGCFENVGGRLLDAVMDHANPHARFAICGMISGYDGAPIPMRNPALILTQRFTFEGFIVTEHLDAWPTALAELGEGVASGTLRYRETVANGILAAPEAFVGMLRGENLGKQLVAL